jgi:hypothetical protein
MACLFVHFKPCARSSGCGHTRVTWIEAFDFVPRRA